MLTSVAKDGSLTSPSTSTAGQLRFLLAGYHALLVIPALRTSVESDQRVDFSSLQGKMRFLFFPPSVNQVIAAAGFSSSQM